uniref:Tetrapyrrole methylase domain-containing protein n=1 Tax=Chromera velia CCMP2878 TaxID=1169474 RepID=A0A0G4HRS7_9ALVE|eukprot:Cvel_8123.t1-p1 / transcript=Cvel_8123.t1 / gene=Cvel_8123 / organism=Chromera_velia_CCMP2878 / gene_product=Ribosomal RNA small subunit methyltransferase I, putative / transcript_product=Ribosomal RNA small subunit methyltransferase I, putative / location=Cvel_scaffold442:3144-5269(-) / protein_length=456 / sequence_SO=supercontig / SO=protein_coding / is_pseudo=false
MRAFITPPVHETWALDQGGVRKGRWRTELRGNGKRLTRGTLSVLKHSTDEATPSETTGSFAKYRELLGSLPTGFLNSLSGPEGDADRDGDAVSVSPSPGSVCFVATPIGNLGDISLEALSVLASADFILAEDSRVASRLLSALGFGLGGEMSRKVEGKQEGQKSTGGDEETESSGSGDFWGERQQEMDQEAEGKNREWGRQRRKGAKIISCHAHNWRSASEELIRRWEDFERRQGRSPLVAVTCDAGTPGISDPGAQVGRELLRWRPGLLSGGQIKAVGGASALILCLSVAALATGVVDDLCLSRGVVFFGFIPSKGAERKRKVREIVELVEERGRAVVLFESPRRVLSLLEALGQETREGGRFVSAVVCRELTKLHENIFFGTVEEAVASLLHSEVKLGTGSKKRTTEEKVKRRHPGRDNEEGSEEKEGNPHFVGLLQSRGEFAICFVPSEAKLV